MRLSEVILRVSRFIAGTVLLLSSAALSFTQSSLNDNSRRPRHFDRALIVVLENQDYESAIKNDLLKSLAQKGAVFSNFQNLYHNSYPNYLAMIAGSDFGVHSPQIRSDQQRKFSDDADHKTIGNLLEWKNYAEDYPSSQAAQQPFLGDRKGRYVRRHVPFLSFRKVQTTSFHNVVPVDTHDPSNAFVTDVAAFLADPQNHRLPEYIFYSPNLDDDGHDPTSNPQQGLKKATDWLRTFLTTWLHFDDQTWLPKDEQLKRTLVIVTFDESEGKHQPERIYTVFLGAMVKAQEVTTPCNHYTVLRTIEDNFGLPPLHSNSGDGAASVINGIWK